MLCLLQKKSDDQTNIDKNRVAVNITEYHIASKLVFLKIIIRQLSYVKNVRKNIEISPCLKRTY